MSSANTIRRMHLRRALLLFAIVLGTAALVASLSRPADDGSPAERAPDPGPATAAPRPESEAREPLSFDAATDESLRLRAGSAATVEVSVEEPGSVEIPGLGLSSPADALTPARFEVLPARAGDYEIVFTPAAGDSTETAGKLVVTSGG
jgi:hypothetical protein